MSEEKKFSGYDLDEGVLEYFEFKIKGHHYKFRYLNTEETEAFQKVIKDKKDVDELSTEFSKFITKVDEKSPEFLDIINKMLPPHWRKFMEMITTEFGA